MPLLTHQASKRSDEWSFRRPCVRAVRRAPADPRSRPRLRPQRDHAGGTGARSHPRLPGGAGGGARRDGVHGDVRPRGVRRSRARRVELRRGPRGDLLRGRRRRRDHERAEQPGVVADPSVRHRGAEADLPAPARLRGPDRLLCVDRAGGGERCRCAAHPGDPQCRRRLRARRHEDVDHQWAPGRDLRHLREPRPREAASRGGARSSSRSRSTGSRSARSRRRWASRARRRPSSCSTG